jgi:hypothetical protein
VLDEITSWLKPDALTCLSLTCKEILRIAGRKARTECRSKQQCWDQTKGSWTNLRYSLILLLKHEHIFRDINPRSPLCAADIINLPVRLCPHQTTSIERLEPNRYTKGRLPSGILSYSIATVVPPSLRGGAPKPSTFSDPIPSERNQMDFVVFSVDALWTC